MNLSEIKLPIPNYNIEVDKSVEYRWSIIVIELEINNRPTGRIISEPYDPVRGNIEELQNRFINRIKSDKFEYSKVAEEQKTIANTVGDVVSYENTKQLDTIMSKMDQFHKDMGKLTIITDQVTQITEKLDTIDNHLGKIMDRVEYLIDTISNYINRSILDRISSIFRRHK